MKFEQGKVGQHVQLTASELNQWPIGSVEEEIIGAGIGIIEEILIESPIAKSGPSIERKLFVVRWAARDTIKVRPDAVELASRAGEKIFFVASLLEGQGNSKI